MSGDKDGVSRDGRGARPRCFRERVPPAGLARSGYARTNVLCLNW